MTIATVQENIDKAKNGPDKNILPDMALNIPLVGGDDASSAFSVKGFRALGLIDDGNLTDVTAFQVHVSNLIDGTFAPLDIEDFPAGSLLAHGTTFIAEWAYAKIVLIGTLSTTGNIPLSLS